MARLDGRRREQMVLFAGRFDDSISRQDTVRYLDNLLGRLNWAR